MSENATHIIVHHYIDGASSLYFSMVCCIILIVIVVIVVCFFLGFVIYVVVTSKKSQQLSRHRSIKRITKPENHSSRNLIEDSSPFNAVGTPVSSVQEFDMAADTNVQSIPLSTFRRHSANDKIGGSTESSAELYDVLFPKKQGHEIIFNPPKKLVTFAGQVYASGESSSQTNLISAPSTSRLAYDNTSGSLEWDYFQQNNTTESSQSDGESETEIKQLQTLCWV